MSRRLLVPIDGTPLSTQALEFAFTHFPEATVIGLHVQNPVDPSYGDELELPVSEEEWQRSEAAERIEIVTEFVAAEARAVATDYDAAIEIITAEGKPYREIVDYVERNDIDHVVIGSHGRTGQDRLLLGSVSENVVHQSPVTVTVVREPATQ